MRIADGDGIGGGRIDIGSFEVQGAAGPTADFDGDGDRDGADFLRWQRGVGLTGGAATLANGNSDGDGDVDGTDLAVWKIQFGQASTAPAAPAAASHPSQALPVKKNRQRPTARRGMRCSRAAILLGYLPLQIRRGVAARARTWALSGLQRRRCTSQWRSCRIRRRTAFRLNARWIVQLGSRQRHATRARALRQLARYCGAGCEWRVASRSERWPASLEPAIRNPTTSTTHNAAAARDAKPLADSLCMRSRPSLGSPRGETQVCVTTPSTAC